LERPRPEGFDDSQKTRKNNQAADDPRAYQGRHQAQRVAKGYFGNAARDMITRVWTRSLKDGCVAAQQQRAVGHQTLDDGIEHALPSQRFKIGQDIAAHTRQLSYKAVIPQPLTEGICTASIRHYSA
jgi:hypothetical protein